ncbi:helix-turn-helix domain-containing protein [bacterium]|nr:helix-turn-helix domain-containing protein [bacterium]
MIVLANKLYTSDETADVIGVTSRTLYRYVKNGEISPETKTKSGTYRFVREEIYKYLYPDNFKEILEQVKLVEQESTKYSTPGNTAFDMPTQTRAQDISQHLPAQSSTNNTQPNNLVGDDVDSAPLSLNKEESPAPTPINTEVPPLEEEIDLDKELKDLEKDLTANISAPAPATANFNENPNTYNSDTSQNLKTVVEPELSAPAPAQSSNTNDSVSPLEESKSINSGSTENSNNNTNNPSPLTTENSGSSTGEPWNYYSNEGLGLLEIAKKLNDLSKETGRKYAATMYGGLSLHQDIDEFFTIHFYVESEDLNWWIEQLGLKSSEKEKANVCLIASSDTNIFKDAYKLRGLFVASDQKLIEDLMKNGEKELAKSLI